MTDPAGAPAAPPASRLISKNAVRISVRVFAAVLAVVCVAALTLLTTARRTVLSAGYYQQVLDDQRAYERLYDEVLVDPSSSAIAHDLLAQVPVPNEQLLSNLKLVLPPTTLRELVGEQIDAVVRYLRGDSDALRLRVNLAPVLANLKVLVQVHLGDLVSQLPDKAAPDFAAFMNALSAELTKLSQGKTLASLPTLHLSGDQQQKAEHALLAVVPADSRGRVRPAVAAALASGDIATALATVAPYALSAEATDAYRDLITRAGGSRWDVLADLENANLQLGAVKEARSFTSTLLGPGRLVAALLGLAAMALFWWTSRSPAPRRLAAVGGLLAGGGVLAFVVLLIVRWRVRRMVPAPPDSWPTSLRLLVVDLQHAGAATLFGIGAALSAVPVVAGLLLVAAGELWQRRPVPRRVWRRIRVQPVILAAATAVVAGTVLGVALVPAAAAEQRCLGSEQLCSMRYDQVAYLTTHNAMSTTEARFFAPLQDPDIISQLDEGARALQLDTYTWEDPNEVAARLAPSDWPESLKAQLPNLINTVTPSRPGLWLCHTLCRAGASPLVPTLERLRNWLEANPDEIVTLIIQDGITAEQTIKAFKQAGLDRLIFTPPADPNAPWPTLGEMIQSGRRLVVFAEEADGPAPWYRNFYKYGMETPFAASSPNDLSCAPARGGVGKRLFLLNNFVTPSTGSRVDAAIVNGKQYLLDRVHRCESERHHAVNFIAVDYATLGNALGVVNELNAARVAG